MGMIKKISLPLSVGNSIVNHGGTTNRSLSRSFSATANRRKCTMSYWIKRHFFSGAGSGQQLMGSYDGGSWNISTHRFDGSDRLTIAMGSGVGSGNAVTFNVNEYKFVDPAAWYHLVVAMDMDAAIANRLLLYVNGVLAPTWSTYNPNGTNMQWNFPNGNNRINSAAGGGSTTSGCSMAYVHIIDGQQLAADKFGEFSSNGIWVPKAYSGTYGVQDTFISDTNSGTDLSGGSNNWSTSGTGTTADSPTKNLPVINPLQWHGSGITLSDGNTKVSYGGTGGPPYNYATSSSLLIPRTGKYYWELTLGTVGQAIPGIIKSDVNWDAGSMYPTSGNQAFTYAYNGTLTENGSSTGSWGSSYTTGDIIGIALNADNNQIYFSKNGAWQNSANPVSGTNPVVIPDIEYLTFFHSGSSASPSTISHNWGQSNFSNSTPTGYLALNIGSLTEPAHKKPSQLVNVLTYTGNGGTQAITGMGHQPDLVILKNRDQAGNWSIFDSARGATKRLRIAADTEATVATSLTSFDTDGFSLGNDADANLNGSKCLALGFKQQTGVFQIVQYAGNGSNRTIAHSLGTKPSLVMVKQVDGSLDLNVQHKDVPAANRMRLNASGAQENSPNIWNSIYPTSSVFSVGSNDGTNKSGNTYIAYLWCDVSGLQNFGKYTGNNSADGTFVYLGFKPKLVIAKAIDTADNWFLWDSTRSVYNPSNKYLSLESTSIEATGGGIDFLSNGFKHRAVAGHGNGANVYIYMAWAKHPTGGRNTPPATAR